MIAAHGRGTLILRTWHDPERGAVVLEVNDDGPGVPDDVQAKIFDPFFTTKEVGKGTGLGLTVAYAIIQEHGGRLTMKSQPGGGASFFVELPLSDAGLPPNPKPPERTFAPPASAAGATILVVEDEAALGAAVAEALADAGFSVDRAGDGVEALERVQARAYDLIVCDLKMPRLDGPSFFRELEKRNAPLARRILFVTGDVAGTEAEHFLEESGCRWLAKPFRLKDLLRSASDLITAG